jgi:hypothetical protein
MTPRSLMKHLEDIPEELMDVDIEYMLSVKEIDGYTFIEDDYVGAIIYDDEEKTVKLCSSETFDEFYKFISKEEE